MALDDLVKNRAMEVGEVKSSLDAEDVEMPEQWWQHLAEHDPHWLTMWINSDNKKQIKYFISLLDTVIQDEIDGTIVTDEQEREARAIRDELIEKL